jgi:tRNA nucleotidyltransferase (CCA-adding enzyme)
LNLAHRFSEFSSDIQSVLQRARSIADRRLQRGVIVGGCVRDLLLNRSSGDVDLMFEPPVAPLVDELAAACDAAIVSHPRFMTFTLKGKNGWKVDVVTARTESYPVPAQLPAVTPSTLEEDFCRRDFTINAMACLISGAAVGDLLDPLHGRSDLDDKTIRALHSRSFEDDPTRIFRAARFAGRFGFRIETETQKWIDAAIAEKRPLALSPVRRRHEFELILKEADPTPALELLESWNALRFLHPAWFNLPKAKLKLSSAPVLEDRLAEWFGSWGKEQAQRQMNELSFEKSVKSAVLSKLVQSGTGS